MKSLTATFIVTVSAVAILLSFTGCQKTAETPATPTAAQAIDIQTAAQSTDAQPTDIQITDIQSPQTTAPDLAKPQAVPPQEKPLPKSEKIARRNNAGLLAADSLTYDFGDVEPGSTVKGEFILTNQGKEPLQIKRPIRKSCGCTTPNVSKYELQPGESTPLSLTFKAPTQPGKTHKFVWVDTEAPALPNTLDLKIAAHVKQHIDAQPEKYRFEVRPDQKETPPLVLKSTDNIPFKITGASATKDAVNFSFDPDENTTEHLVNVTPVLDKLRDALRGRITIDVDHPKLNKVMVDFETVLPFSSHPAARLFPQLVPGKQVTEKVTIVSNFNEPFEIESAASDQGLVTVLSQTPSDDGWELLLAMTLPENATSPTIRDFVSVKIKDRPQDSIRILCSGTRAAAARPQPAVPQTQGAAK